MCPRSECNPEPSRPAGFASDSFSSRTRRFERCAAAASPGSIRVLDVKAGAGEPVAIIQRRPAQKIRALAIDQKFHAFFFDDGIAGALSIEAHFVLQAGAAAFRDLDAQALALARRLRFEQRA